MNRPLSRKRHIENEEKWSDNINNFLNASPNLEINDKNHVQNSSSLKNIKRIQVKPAKRSNYEVAKKAFLNSQRHQTIIFKKYQNQVAKTDVIINKRKLPSCIQKQYDFTHAPVNQVDNHIIEKVISKRNKEYKESSKYITSGYVVDLKRYHSLPPERNFYVHEKSHIYFQ